MTEKTKVFIVEDDPLMIRMYERIFRLSGFDVELTKDGEKVIPKIQTMIPPPSIILLDIMLPKMSGFEVLEKLKSDANLSKIPVVVLSNLSGKADAEKAVSLGAIQFFIKSDHTP